MSPVYTEAEVAALIRPLSNQLAELNEDFDRLAATWREINQQEAAENERLRARIQELEEASA